MEPREKFSPEFKEIVERIPDNYSTLLVWGLLFFVGLLILLSIIIKVPALLSGEILPLGCSTEPASGTLTGVVG